MEGVTIQSDRKLKPFVKTISFLCKPVATAQAVLIYAQKQTIERYWSCKSSKPHMIRLQQAVGSIIQGNLSEIIYVILINVCIYLFSLFSRSQVSAFGQSIIYEIRCCSHCCCVTQMIIKGMFWFGGVWFFFCLFVWGEFVHQVALK